MDNILFWDVFKEMCLEKGHEESEATKEHHDHIHSQGVSIIEGDVLLMVFSVVFEGMSMIIVSDQEPVHADHDQLQQTLSFN